MLISCCNKSLELAAAIQLRWILTTKCVSRVITLCLDSLSQFESMIYSFVYFHLILLTTITYNCTQLLSVALQHLFVNCQKGPYE